MSSALRLSIILVLLLATTALGLIAYNMNLPKEQAPIEVTDKAPVPASAPSTVGLTGTSACVGNFPMLKTGSARSDRFARIPGHHSCGIGTLPLSLVAATRIAPKSPSTTIAGGFGR